jgi:cellulose synthase/poly-beta-1,6-N-acetylglucosamine synthase-like glycosyltransferase
MPRPLITIPIAAYKTRPDHLSAAVESALAQTWEEIEVIVADDSPGESLHLVVDAFRDSRLRYRHNSPRLGAGANYWSCLAEAKGKYVAILNHDDLFSPTLLEKLAPHLVHDTGLALAFCDNWVIDENGHRLVEASDRLEAQWGKSNLREGVHRPFFDLLASQTIPVAAGTVFRRSLIARIPPPQVGPAYDLWLAYLLCRDGYGAYHVADRLSSWRMHAASLTSKGGADWSRDTALCWQTVSRDENLSSIHKVACRKAARAHASCALSLRLSGQRRDCFECGLNSLKMEVTWRGLAACLLPMLPKRLVTLFRSPAPDLLGSRPMYKSWWLPGNSRKT